MSACMWKNKSSQKLLMEIENGTSTLENSLAVKKVEDLPIK